LTTHVRPDGDAIGSTLAMAQALEGLGKEVVVVGDFDVPPRLRFLDPSRRIRRLGVDVSPEQLDAVDVLMVLDTSAWAQLGAMGDPVRATKAAKVVIDHHPSGDSLGGMLLKDPTVEATGRLVVELVDRLGVPVSPPMATQLFAALATDTGWFRFASATEATYRLAARLVDAGAVPSAIYRELHERESLARLLLAGRALSRAEVDLGGRLIHTWIARADFDAVGALPSDSEDLINLTLAVEGAQVAVILVEQPGGRFKVSFRSRCDVDCSRLAETFGGGGHVKASGATLQGSLETVRATVLDAVRAAMR
jgi:phosphoesterase RecJ-like protein